MAGWLSVLQWVPWGEVIANAPKVAEAAKKLWKTTRQSEADTPPAAARTTPASLGSVQAQLDAVEAQMAHLQEQMLASSELIKALAEQNTQLVDRIEKNRTRMRWLGAAAVLGLLLGSVSLALVLPR